MSRNIARLFAFILVLLTVPGNIFSQGLEESFDISRSGVLVQKFRLRLIAENIANLVTLKTEETGLPYQRKYPVLESTPTGVRVVAVARSEAPFPKYFDPEVPMADELGFRYFPNVNLPDEYVDLAMVEVMYEANITSFKSAKTMYQKALEMLK